MKKIISVFLSFCILSGVLSFGVYADSAASSVVIAGDTGEILYAKAENTKRAMASTTKIMTALLLCEKFPNLDTKVTVSKTAVNIEGSSMGLKAGDTVSARDLLYGMMLSSGNDAANAAAEAVSGSIEAFVSLMNKRAFEMGLNNTHFDTPSGLDGKNHYTTAVDLANLTRIALQNEQLSLAAATKTVTLRRGESGEEYTLKNHNRLLFMYDDIIGVKTGFTKKAGRCLVSAARRDGKYVIVVTLFDRNDWADHRELIDMGYKLLGTQKRVKRAGTVALKIASGGSEEISVPAYTYFAADSINISEKIYLPHILYLPVSKGEELGRVEYFADFKSVKIISILANEDKAAKEYAAKQRFFTYFKMLLRI